MCAVLSDKCAVLNDARPIFHMCKEMHKIILC